MANFSALLSPEQAGPGLYGVRSMNDIYKQMINNQYLPGTLAAQLQNQQLVNQYYGPKAESEMELQRHHGNYYEQMANWFGPEVASKIALNDLIGRWHGAQAGLVGAQTNEINIGNEREHHIDEINRQIEEELNRQNAPQPQPYSPQGAPPNLAGALNQPDLGAFTTPNTPERQRSIQQHLQDMQAQGGYVPPGSIEQPAPPSTLGQAATATRQTPMQSAPVSMGQPTRLDQLLKQRELLMGQTKGRRGAAESPEEKEARAEALAEKRSELRVTEAEKKENIKSYSQELKGSNETAKDAVQMKNLIKQFNNAYSKITSKGPVLGRAPAISSETQTADNAAQNMQQMILKLMKTNRMTNYELQFAGNLKLNRTMNPQAVKDIGNFLDAKADRLVEQQKFITAAKNKGMPAEEAKTLWNTYDNERPVYDFETRKVNKENLNSSKDYLNPEALESIHNIGAYSPTTPTTTTNAPVGNYTQEDLEHTAKLRGISVEEVKRKLGVK